MYPDTMRASDADRQRVVDALQHQAGEGRLTLAEFDERSASAYNATTLGELRKLTKDLPVGELPLGASAHGPFGEPGGAGLPWRQTPGDVPVSRGRHLATTAAVVLIVLFVASTTISLFTHMFFFPLPFILLAFAFMRMGGGGHNRGGPGYHHQ